MTDQNTNAGNEPAATPDTPPAEEQTSTATANTPPPSDGFEPITSQEQLNKVVADRVRRAEAKVKESFADYDDLKTAAAAAETANEELTALRAAVLNRAVADAATKTTVKAEHLPALLGDGLTTVKVNTDGTVEGLDALVTAFLDSNPEYLKTEVPDKKPGVGKQDADRKSPPPKTDITAQIAAAEQAKDWDTVNRLNAQLLLVAAQQS